MTEPAPRTAIIVPIELPSALERIRQRGDPMARLGVPAHVTLLFPFMPAGAVSSGVLEDLAVVVAGQAAFDVAFSTVRSFPSTAPTAEPAADDVLWLAPEPAALFSALIDRLAKAYPEYPPYGGAHEVVVPHLTLATGDAARSLARETRIRRSLPVRRRVDEAALLVEDLSGRWALGPRFPLKTVLQLD